MTRVIHVAETTAGGVGVVVRELALDQTERGLQVAVAAPAGGPVPDALSDAGVRFFRWDARPQPGPWTAGELVALQRILRSWEPDVVHLHSSKAGLTGRLLLRRRVPTVMQPHAWSFFARTGPVRAAALRWERLGARWADVILCVSDDERRLGRESGVNADFRVLPNGVDLERFPPPRPDDRAAARAELGLSRESPVAVCVGRLHRQKNQGALVAAWPSVRSGAPGAELLLVGDGPDRPELEAVATEGVSFVGQVDDVRPWLLAANVVLQPSRWEGMSLSLLESLAAGRSVVVTDVPGMREVVAEGVGTVVPRDDATALTDAIVTRLVDGSLADREGRTGRARVEEHHDRRVQFDAIAALYDELLEARG